MDKEMKIVPPEGYEIDKENSTFECIKFKKIKKLPKTWEEFCKCYSPTGKECFIDKDSEILEVHPIYEYSQYDSRNILPNKSTAEAMLALCQLIQLRDYYNDGWTPDCDTSDDKYSINICFNKIEPQTWKVFSRVLSFKTKELRDQFLENFRDLIEIAKPLL